METITMQMPNSPRQWVKTFHTITARLAYNKLKGWTDVNYAIELTNQFEEQHRNRKWEASEYPHAIVRFIEKHEQRLTEEV